MKNTITLLKRGFILVALFNMLHCSSDDTVTTEDPEETVQDTPEETPEDVTPPDASQRLLRIPVTHHISRTSNGTNPAIDNTRAAGIIADLNTGYEGTNITFFTKEIRFVDNSEWNNAFDIDLDRGDNRVLLPFEDANSLNIFYFSTLSESGDTSLAATALFPRDGNNIKLSSTAYAPSNRTTAAHEVGHYFGLFHTDDFNFDTVGRTELVDGSNCRTAGDFICDTAAAPELTEDVIGDNCNYIGTQTDENGQLFTPDILNFMTTFAGADNNGISCRRHFSPQQIEAMRGNIIRIRAGLIGEEGCNTSNFTGFFETENSNLEGAPFPIEEADINEEEVDEDDEENIEEDEISIGLATLSFADSGCNALTISGDFLNLGCFNTDLIVPITLVPTDNATGNAVIETTTFSCSSVSGMQTLVYTISATGTYNVDETSITLNYTTTVNGTTQTGTLSFRPLQEEALLEGDDPTDEDENVTDEANEGDDPTNEDENVTDEANEGDDPTDEDENVTDEANEGDDPTDKDENVTDEANEGDDPTDGEENVTDEANEGDDPTDEDEIANE